MTATTKNANPGYEAGIAQRSKAERLAWTLKGAPPRKKDKRLNALEGILEGRKLALSLAGKLTTAELQTSDGAVALVFAKRDNLGKIADPVEIFRYPSHTSDSDDLEAARRHILDVPVGFILCVLDREKRNVIAHARPLIIQDSALQLLEAVLEKATTLTDWRMS
jgi:hypothetical protein